MIVSLNVGGEVTLALRALKPEDRKRISEPLAQTVIETVFKIREREKDSGQAIRYTLSRHHIGSTGLPESREKVFTAYWRLLRKVLDNRERDERLAARRKRRAA